jgi:non-ribosomal peptide synthase protein (TIGR01720 family)
MNSLEAQESLEAIAIVGMAGRFPGAKNPEEFWQNLANGVESVSFFSDEELAASGIDPSLLTDPNYVKAGAVLEDVDLFAASFFDFNPKEADITDPQHRLFLECAWEALENAGYAPQRYQGKTGVYGGASLNNYHSFDLNRDRLGSSQSYQTLIGNDKDFLTTRVSYKLNLTGPSITVQTACSTSLVATVLACQSLLNYQCDLALAGGVSIRVPQKTGYMHEPGGTLSHDGHCRAFDAEAGGMIIGNGVGVVALKRLSEAIADGDYIHAVIKGAAINNDGAGKVSYTAPSVDGQAEVIAEAMMLGEVEPETISYIQAHGTGTALGDPIEIAALSKVFQANTTKKGFCAVSSVKTNIGHLDAAAGIAGLIQTVLALKHKSIPPSLNFGKPNPEIDFDNSPFYVNTKLKAWETKEYPRRAGVSSLGIGGTNAHVVLEEAPIDEIRVENGSRSNLLVISAKTESALETATDNLVEHFNQHPELDLADVAYTLQVGRSEFNYRRLVVGKDIEDVAIALSTREPKRVLTHCTQPEHHSVVFMFPGQGSQYINMGQELYETEPVFRQWIDRCSRLLEPELGLDLRSLIYPNDEKLNTVTEKLKQTQIAQPAIFVIEYALAQLWMSWGIQPQAAIGHSIGEYVAATIAGVFSLENALHLVALRGRLMQQMTAGSMLAVSLSVAGVKGLLNDKLSLAAINAPDLCVISGSNEAIVRMAQELSDKGIECRHLHTSHAFHSTMMDGAIAPLTQAVSQIKLNPPQIPFISNVTGTWIQAEEATNPDYWARHARETVRFTEGISELLQDKNRILLEVGAGRTLSTLVRKNPTQAAGQTVLSSLRHPQETVSDTAFILDILGRLWLTGLKIDWCNFAAHQQRHRLPLPTYPFERQSYWLNSSPKDHFPSPASLDKKNDIADWFYLPRWKQSIPLELLLKQKLEPQLCWLVFVDSYGVAAEIVERLKQEDRDVIVVRIADNFAKLNDLTYTINPQQRDDYHLLLQALQEQNWTPQRIAHFWSLSTNDILSRQDLGKDTQLESRYQFFEDCQNLGFYSLLFLAQALAKQNLTESIELKVVTNNLHDVTGSENLCPEKATILAPCKVIPQEYPNITCCCFDVVLGESEIQPSDKLIDHLLGEFSVQSTDNVVAYRGHHRWIQTYEPIPLNDSIVEGNKLRTGGVYLIVGGLGGVGLVLAEYLARTVQAKLILIGRTDLPKRDQWQEWLATHDEEDNISRKIGKVQQLLALDAEVLVIKADVANEPQMHDAIVAATQEFGEINGVIHAAGEKTGCAIAQSNPASSQSQFNPKVYGLFVLSKVLQGQKLDFCQLTSSLASVLGGLGFVSYAAANIFMDAFVHNYNKTTSFPWSSLNWDNWSTEDEPQNTDITHISHQSLYQYGMTSKATGMDAFERLLSISGLPQVIISSGDLQVRIEEWIKLESLQPRELSNNENLFLKHQRPNLSIEYIAPRNKVEQTIANIWQEILGMKSIGIHDNFFELGGNSMNAIQIAAKANQVNLKLTTEKFFQHQTIAELTSALDITQNVQIQEYSINKELKLTPIQHWFLSQNYPNLHHTSQSLLLEIKQVGDPDLLEQTLLNLIQHHDIFRLRFKQKKTGWQQHYTEFHDTIKLERVDLPLLPENERKLAIESKREELAASLNLFEGPLIRFAYFEVAEQQSSYLLIIIHHLAVDHVSWQILLEDLQTAYQQISQVQEIDLPDCHTSYVQWVESLQEYAESVEMVIERDYWIQEMQKPITRLPVDYATDDNTAANAGIVSVCLDKQKTKALLEEIHQTYNTQVNDVLLTALVQTFAKWTGENKLRLDLKGNGREKILKNPYISNTIGLFTTNFPVILDTTESSDQGDSLIKIKESLRSIPNSGVGYGILQYLNGEGEIPSELQSLTQSEVSFNYLGQYDQIIPKSSLFSLPHDSQGISFSTPKIPIYLLEITGIIVREQLQLSWTYNQAIHQQETIKVLAENFIEELSSLISHCLSLENVIYTPSDFPEANLNQQNLDRFLAKINQTS